jgi:hypothetical protein
MSSNPNTGYNTSVNLSFSGGVMPAGMFPGQTTCAVQSGIQTVPALPWVMSSSPQMYNVSTTPNANFGGGASTSACFDPSVCSAGEGTNPVGYIITGSGSGNVQVFCASYGVDGYKDHCTARGMIQDSFSNLCLRTAVFQDPNTRYPNLCPVIPDLNYRNNPTVFANFPNLTRPSVLYGQSAKTADLTNPSFPGYNGEKIIEGTDYKSSPCTGLYDPTRVYKFNDVVASYVTNILGSVDNSKALTGPFFRNILPGSGVAPPSAPNTNEFYSDPALEGPLSNGSWTNSDIASKWQNYFQRFAGYDGNLNQLCVTSDGTPTGTQIFCPPVCVTQCPLGDPDTQVGLYEPGYISSYDSGTNRTTVTESNCWPRCGPSDVYQGAGDQCILAAFSSENLAAFTNCENGTLPVVQLNNGLPNGGHSFNRPDQSPPGPRFYSASTGQCYGLCPTFTQIYPFQQANGATVPQDNFTTCEDVCPESESFYDGGTACFKIAAQREPYVDSNASTLIETALNSNLTTSSKFSKFSLSGGLQNLLTILGIILAIGVFTGLVLLIKNRHTVKSQQYFSLK